MFKSWTWLCPKGCTGQSPPDVPDAASLEICNSAAHMSGSPVSTPEDNCASKFACWGALVLFDFQENTRYKMHYWASVCERLVLPRGDKGNKNRQGCKSWAGSFKRKKNLYRYFLTIFLEFCEVSFLSSHAFRQMYKVLWNQPYWN